MIYWRVVVAVTVVSFPVCVIVYMLLVQKQGLNLITLPSFPLSLDSVSFRIRLTSSNTVVCLEPKYLKTPLSLNIFDIALDIITDMMSLYHTSRHEAIRLIIVV